MKGATGHEDGVGRGIKSFGARIKLLAERAGSNEKLAAVAGLSGKMIANYIAGAEPTISKLQAIAFAMGVSTQWLLTGEGPMKAGDAIAETVAEYRSAVYEAAAEVNKDFVFVRMMQGRISAGGGLVPDNRPEMAIAFRREWLERKGDPERMSAIRVEGDSMVPTLQPSDIILVNHNVNTVTANGGIYAIAFQDEIIVKRVEVMLPTGQLRIISDNKEYKEFGTDPDQVIINGKVIWYGRDLER